MAVRRILHVIHDFLPRHAAGSEIYADALCRALTERYEVTVLAAEHDLTRPHGQLAWRHHAGLPVVELVNNWASRTFEDTYDSALLTERVGQVLDAVQPHVVHVHNLLNLSFALPELARARGIPVVATLHDYTLVCASGGQRVHRDESHVCHAIDVERCARCFQQSSFAALTGAGRVSESRTRAGLGGALTRRAVAGVQALTRRVPGLTARAARLAAHAAVPSPSTALRRRLARARDAFASFDLVIAPSQSIADEYASLGFPVGRLSVSDYGFVPLSAAGQQAPARLREPGTPVRFAFLGTLVWHKGLHVLLEAIRALPQVGWSLDLHGDPQVFPDYTAQLRRQADGLPVRFQGPYAHDRVGAILAGIDALVVPSVWLENSPLVIHEAFQAGVPVVGARIGGIPDLITDDVNGVLYDASSPADLARVLRGLLDEPARLTRLARGVPRVKTIGEDAAEWQRRYDSLLARQGRAGAPGATTP